MIKLIILAAGEGTRLYPYTKNLPKCMVKIKNRAIIEWQLLITKRSGIDNITVIGGYKFDKLKYLKKQNIKLEYNPQFSKTNMVSSLFCIEDKLKGNILLSYGDIIYSKNILDLVINSKDDIGVVTDLEWRPYWEKRTETPLDDAESFRVDRDGNIIDIGFKESNLNNIQGQYIGLIKFSETGINTLKKTYNKCLEKGSINGKAVNNAYMTDIIQEMIFSGHKIRPVYIKDPWIEIDTVDDLENNVTIDRLNHIIREML